MKKISKEEIESRLNNSRLITGYIYKFIGTETQKDNIEVYCPTHDYTQPQKRENAFFGRKIKCCNDNSPLTIEKYNEKIKQFSNENSKIELIEEFKGGETKVKISCTKHNTNRIIKITSLFSKKFEYACNKCSHEQYNRNFAFSKEEWIQRSNKVHNDRYDYFKMEDVGLHRTITCKKHGDFLQNIHNHVYLANGCPKCVIMPSISSAENELQKYFTELGFIETVDYIRSDRSAINPKELDFYFPKLNIGIEYNGDYWHSTSQKEKTYHQNKKILGLKNNINIIMIYEHDWKNKTDIIKARLKSILKKDKIVFARKTNIKNVSYKISKEFCEKYHLHGWAVSKYNYGLFNENDELLALMTFGKSRFTKHQYELIRYVSVNTVVGGASKLFSHFIKEIRPKNVLSYADLDWSNGNLYVKLGFTEISKTSPSYVWVKGDVVLSRYKTQMKNENKIMAENGFVKIYKSGSIKYEFYML